MPEFVEVTDETFDEVVPEKTEEQKSEAKLDLWAPSSIPNTLLNSKEQTDLSKIEGLEKPKPEFWSEVVPAVYQRDDSVISYFSKETIDNTFARQDYVLNIDGYEEHASQFGEVFSKEHEEAVKRSIDRQRKNSQIVDDAGALGVAASIGAGFLSPTSILLLPFSGGVGPFVNAIKTGNVLKGALLASRTGAIISSIDEVALHATQETRTFGDSVFNIAGATFLSGVVGGSIGLYKSSKIKSASKQIEDFMDLPKEGASDYLEPNVVPLTTKELEADTSISAMFGDGSGGAARTSIAENKIKSTRGLEKLDFLNPVMEVMTSKEIQTRRIGSELFDNPFIFQDNAKGIAKVTSVEGDIRRDLMIFDTKIYTFNEKAFSDYTGSWKDRIQRKVSGGEKRLNRTEFAAEFDVATRNGDRSSIPQVQELAKNVRVLTDALGDAALKHKVNDFLPDSPIGAETWGMRVWDKKAMNDEHERLSDIVFKDYREGNKWRDPIIDSGESFAKSQLIETAGREDITKRVETFKSDKVKEKELISAIDEERKSNLLQTKKSAAFEKKEIKATPINKDKNRKIRSDIDSIEKKFPKGKETKKSISQINDLKEKIKSNTKEFRKKESLDAAEFGKTIAGREIQSAMREEISVLKKQHLVDIEDLNVLKKQHLEKIEGLKEKLKKDKRLLKDKHKKSFENKKLKEIKEIEDSLNLTLKDKLSDIEKKLNNAVSRLRARAKSKGRRIRNIRKIDELETKLNSDLDSIKEKHLTEKKRLTGKKRPELEKELTQSRKATKEKLKEANRNVMDDLELRDLTLKTINNMKSMPDDVPIWNVTQRMGVGKARKYRIPDNLMLDFFVQDPVTNLVAYARKVTTLIHLKKRGFDPEGFAAKLTTIKENVRLAQFKQIEIIKAKFSEKIKKATSKKESNALLKQEASDIAKVIRKADKIIETDINNLQNIMSRIDGTAQLNKDAVVSASKVLTGSVKTLNYGTMLGNVVASSLSDVATPMLINGTASVLNDSLVIFAREMTTLSKSMRKMRGDLRKRVFQELRDIGYAKDLYDSSRMSSIMGLTESYGGSKLDVVNQGLQKYTGTLSLINWWNAKMKMFTGYLSMAKILRLSNKAVKGDLKTKDIEFLARFGIDDQMVKRINGQFLRHGEEIKGRFASGMTDWDDMEAFRSMHAAIDGFVEQTILTPRQEKPFFMDTEIGSVVFQFTNFPKAAFSKILISGVQQGDMKALSGYISLVTMGAVTVAIKNLQSGRDMPSTIEEWVKESMDKSGAVGHLMGIYDLVERMTGIFKDIGESSDPISTHSAGRIVSGLAGPSFSFAKNAVETGIWTTNLLAHGESPTEGNLAATRRIIPFQNTLMLRNAFDLVGNVTSDLLGAKPSRKKSKSKRRNR